MSIFEYDQEEEEKKLRKAEFEAGYDTGYGTGKLDERSKIVKSMLSAGKMMEKIADYTGCTVEEIEKIRKDFSAE